MSANRDLYSVLGLDSSCSDQDIRDAYARLKEQAEPGAVPAAELDRAFDVLGDIDRRARYDITGKTSVKSGLRRKRGGNARIEKVRYTLNTLFLAGAAITTVLFILQWCGAGTTPFYWACGISIVIKLAEYILRLIP